MKVREPQTGRTIDLAPARKLGAGAQGTVFEVPGDPYAVAKVYFDPPKGDDAEKLRLLADHPLREPQGLTTHRWSAWPDELLLDAAAGHLVGFVMPRLRGQPIERIYNPRCPDFAPPRVRHLVARRAAALIAEVHAHGTLGIVLGDINEENILVDGARVVLLDIDACQVTTADGRVLRCKYGKPEWVAPERVGILFADVDRAPADDAWALAVLIWKLHFHGWHPFADVGPGRRIAEKVRAGRWPHGPRAVAAPPPAAPRFNSQPPVLRKAFARTFDEGHGDPSRRLAAAEWLAVLDAAERHRTTVAGRTAALRSRVQARATQVTLAVGAAALTPAVCRVRYPRFSGAARMMGQFSRRAKARARAVVGRARQGARSMRRRVELPMAWAAAAALVLPLVFVLGRSTGPTSSSAVPGTGRAHAAITSPSLAPGPPAIGGLSTPAAWRRHLGQAPTPEPAPSRWRAEAATRARPPVWDRLRPPPPAAAPEPPAVTAAEPPRRPRQPSSWQDHLRRSFELLRNEVLPR